MLRTIAIAAALLAALVAGCGDTEQGARVTGQDGTPPTSKAPPDSLAPADDVVVPLDPVEPPPSTMPAPAGGPVAAAVADLAVRLGVETADVGVVSAEEVTWRDGAAGCPQPGMAYLQVLTNGSRIRLVVDGTVYQYHTRGGGDPFLCRSPEDPLSTAG